MTSSKSCIVVYSHEQGCIPASFIVSGEILSHVGTDLHWHKSLIVDSWILILSPTGSKLFIDKRSFLCVSLFSIKDTTLSLYMLNRSLFNFQVPLYHYYSQQIGSKNTMTLCSEADCKVREAWKGLRYLNQSVKMTRSLQNLRLAMVPEGDTNDQQVSTVI